MATDIMTLATDVATYVGAVSAGVSANALTGAAQGLVKRVAQALRDRRVDVERRAMPELIVEVEAVLQDDPELLALAVDVFRPVHIDRSIIVEAQNVSGISQTNY